MVHNRIEIERLESLGMETITNENLGNLENSTILFRAHGEPPESYERASKNGNRVIDATCPIVLKLQQRIRETYKKIDHQLEQIVIFGKTDHPETVGLMGQIGNDATVVSSLIDLQKVDPGRRVHLFSQTTMDPGDFSRIESALSKLLIASGSSMKSNCSICSHMKKRKPGLADFAVNYDVMIFVSGKNSSNGKMLFEYCKSLNPNSFWISDENEIDGDWFQNSDSIGISGATSTPSWQLESLRKHIQKLTIV
jgi:4-hydroxy-3-methylbut-2-enyl diphosphate reductase